MKAVTHLPIRGKRSAGASLPRGEPSGALESSGTGLSLAGRCCVLVGERYMLAAGATCWASL